MKRQNLGLNFKGLWSKGYLKNQDSEKIRKKKKKKEKRKKK